MKRQTIYFKVLQRGQSCHGGKLKWSLPKDRKPGGWHQVTGRLKLCVKGLHVTERPHEWLSQGLSVYLCEVSGRRTKQNPQSNDTTKIAVERCRLLRRLRRSHNYYYYADVLRAERFKRRAA